MPWFTGKKLATLVHKHRWGDRDFYLPLYRDGQESAHLFIEGMACIQCHKYRLLSRTFRDVVAAYVPHVLRVNTEEEILALLKEQ